MKKRRLASRGSILVVALGILAILAVIGATMVKIARVDNLAARSFKHGTDLNFAVDSALSWVEYRLSTAYNDRQEVQVYYTGFVRTLIPAVDTWTGGAFDNPNDPREPIALICLNNSGTLVGAATADVARRGLYKTSERSATGLAVFYNAAYAALPNRVNNLPVSATGNHLFDGGWNTDLEAAAPAGKDRLSMLASGNRLIQISVTVLDLSGRYNLNMHGNNAVGAAAAVVDATTGCGQSYLDNGVYLTEVAPNWSSSHARLPYNTTDTFDTSLTALKRWGTDNKSEFADMQMNPQDWSNKLNLAKNSAASASSPYFIDLPLTMEEEFELLHWYGTPCETRLERALPNTFGRTGSETSLDVRSYYRQFFTAHSFVSSIRRRSMTGPAATPDEPMGGLYPKADLNNGPDDDPTDASTLKNNPLRMALLASVIGGVTAYPNKDVDQMVANIIDFRDSDCRPTAIEMASPVYTVIGVDAHPYVNEVFVDIQNKKSETVDGVIYDTIPVYVELANPYEMVVSVANGAYSKLKFGSAHTVVADLPISISSGGPLSTAQKGEVVKFEVRVKQGDSVTGSVFPVELFADARTGGAAPKTIETIVDRFNVSGVQPTLGKSWQRLCVRGKDREGNNNIYFGGWDSRYEERDQTCLNGATLTFGVNPAAADAGAKIARPVENRSLNPATVDKQGRYAEDKMSFRRIGDIARVLRIGHPAAFDSSGNPIATTVKTVSEQLAAKVDGTAASPTTDTVRSLFIDLTDDKYAKVTNFVTVGSPYYDRQDNDADRNIATSMVGVDSQDGVAGHNHDNLGPEIYEHGKINLKTAMPEVIRGMLPIQLENASARGAAAYSDAQLFQMATDICTAAQSSATNPTNPKNVSIKLPVDILKLNFTAGAGGKKVAGLFLGDGCDDDGNGAVDDWTEQTWLYGYMSNWASTRSDSFVVYGTVRIVADRGNGKVEGVRHFVAILDRVPATAYAPFTSVANVNSKTPGTPNPKYLGCRRAMMAWLD